MDKHMIYLMELLKKYNNSKSKFVAWVSAFSPVELIRSFGVDLYFPENTAAALSKKGKSSELISLSSSKKLSSFVCSYAAIFQGLLEKENQINKIKCQKEQELLEKEQLIQKLVEENNLLRTKSYQTQNRTDKLEEIPLTNNTLNAEANYEIAENMKGLYLKLHQAQNELKKMRVNRMNSAKINCIVM